jgi:hypothetical protein
MRERDQLVVALFERCTAEAVEAAIELEVLMHRQLIVERELLRHVADERLDAVGLLGHVEAADVWRGPPSGSSRPHSMRMTVDLPEPFGPGKPKMPPWRPRTST